MNAYATGGWESFFVAEAGAAAALAGLLFVAVSINLARILSIPGIPGRAAEALLLLFGVLVIATLGLIPGQPPPRLGAELLAVGVINCAVILFMQIRDARLPEQRRVWITVRVASTQAGALPIIVAGISLLAGTGGGLYWLAPGVLLSFAAAVMNAWVLLIEIQR